MVGVGARKMGRRKIDQIYINGYKECTQCKTFFSIEKFRTKIQHGRPYIIAKCRKCESETQQMNYDREKRRIREREFYSSPENKKKKNEYRKNWNRINADKSRVFARNSCKKSVAELHDHYLVKLMFRGRALPVPKDLLKLKRLQLICKRELKNLYRAN